MTSDHDVPRIAAKKSRRNLYDQVRQARVFHFFWECGRLYRHRYIKEAEDLTVFAMFGIFNEGIVALFRFGSDFTDVDAVAFDFLFEVEFAADHLAEKADRFLVINVNRQFQECAFVERHSKTRRTRQEKTRFRNIDGLEAIVLWRTKGASVHARRDLGFKASESYVVKLSIVKGKCL